MSAKQAEREISPAQARADAVLFRNAANAIEQINSCVRGVSTNDAVACGKLLKRMFPDRARLEALAPDLQQRFRNCATEAVGRTLDNSVGCLWDTMKKLWEPGGALMDTHHAKSTARVIAAKFCRALAARIEREIDDDTAQREQAA